MERVALLLISFFFFLLLTVFLLLTYSVVEIISRHGNSIAGVDEVAGFVRKRVLFISLMLVLIFAVSVSVLLIEQRLTHRPYISCQAPSSQGIT